MNWQQLLGILKAHVHAGSVTTYGELSLLIYGTKGKSQPVVAMLNAAVRADFANRVFTNRVVGAHGQIADVNGQRKQLLSEGIATVNGRCDLSSGVLVSFPKLTSAPLLASSRVSTHKELSRQISSKEYLAIGWDVGGWQGDKQAVAALSWNSEDSLPTWLSVSSAFSLPKGLPLSLEMLLEPVGLDASQVRTAKRVCIAIDAPLAFPRALQQFLNGATAGYSVPKTESQNKLAYRDCERWVLKQFNKKPLSAMFDKLGNNATLAQAFIPALQTHGFKLTPQQTTDSAYSIIEAYPALLKTGSGKKATPHASISHLLPGGLESGSDPADAALCAIVAAAFLCQQMDSAIELPRLIGAQSGYDLSEGWIYAPEFAAPTT